MKTTISLVLVLALVVGLPAGVANADFTFGTPTNLGPTVNSSTWDLGACIPADGLKLYFTSRRPGGYGGADLWVTTRDMIDDEWGTPVNLGSTVNSSAWDVGPSISADGLSLFFASGPGRGGYGGRDIWVTTRATTEDDWGTPVNLGPTVNSSTFDNSPSISADGLSLFFDSMRPGGSGSGDLWVTTRPTTDDPWGTPVNLGPTVNGPASDALPGISADGLALFFSSYDDEPLRPGGLGGSDIWVTTRATVSDPWGTPVNLGPPVNTSASDFGQSFSADGLTLYFTSNRPGGSGSYDLWQAPIIPIVDFNGDGIVDGADMCIVVDHWGEYYPLCDIGPTPLGDGVVDVQDLIVLAEHLFEDVNDPTLVAHWALDETEGSIVYDSVAANDAVVIGEPVWQPAGGAVDGALAFDGIDDYVSTPFILDPSDGAFSVFAWLKGGAAGQVIISQTGGANWLLADPSEGRLRTSLSRPAGGRSAPQPLISEFVITDGNWHHVGFVWDGSNRMLYVDDVEVARDTQVGLESSEGGLYIGAGKNLEPGSFFSGLIDDVRIYDRAITP